MNEALALALFIHNFYSYMPNRIREMHIDQFYRLPNVNRIFHHTRF